MNGSSPSITAVIAGIVKREGGLVDDPNDPGGLTKFGISQRSYPELDIRSLTAADAATIYERDFYRRPGLDRLPISHVEPVLDMAVNAGAFAAIKLAQRAAGAAVDGKLGPATVAAIAATDERSFRRAFTLERLLFYLSTILARPTSVKYARGWFRRALEVM